MTEDERRSYDILRSFTEFVANLVNYPGSPTVSTEELARRAREALSDAALLDPHSRRVGP